MTSPNRISLALLAPVLAFFPVVLADAGDAVVHVLTERYGVNDEPSLAAECQGDYAAIRILERDAGRNAALIRLEKRAAEVSAVKRMVGDRLGSEEAEMTESEFLEVFAELETSNFWSLSQVSTDWRPDDRMLTIEACWAGEFHFIFLYPDQDRDMDAVIASASRFW
jgi:hypothetical protein